MPTIRNLRDLGSISFEEYVVLVDMATEDEANDLLAADREYCRLRHELDEIQRLSGISSYLHEPRPLAWHLLEQRLARRMYGMTAVVLRRYGEHRLANMMLANPAEFERIRDTQLGAA